MDASNAGLAALWPSPTAKLPGIIRAAVSACFSNSAKLIQRALTGREAKQSLNDHPRRHFRMAPFFMVAIHLLLFVIFQQREPDFNDGPFRI